MRVRYLIERYSDDWGNEVNLVLVDREGEAVGGKGTGYKTLEDAKAEAQKDPELRELEVTWRDPPEAWLPDAICVSQYFEDEGVGPVTREEVIEIVKQALGQKSLGSLGQNWEKSVDRYMEGKAPRTLTDSYVRAYVADAKNRKVV